MVTSYVPDRGDAIWITFNPQAGREQAGRRPAIVLSRLDYNQKSGLAVVCPVTSQVKGYPFEVLLPAGLSISGVILADHVKSIDWNIRQAEFIATISAALVVQVVTKVDVLLQICSR
jgi:mRNA interferase MazF